MTAVTQCPQCGTRFRVVPDQLKISQGWVRCGKCAEVFNAREALETAAALQAGQPAPVHAGAAPHQVSIVLRQQEPALTADTLAHVTSRPEGAAADVGAVDVWLPDTPDFTPHDIEPQLQNGVVQDAAVEDGAADLLTGVQAPVLTVPPESVPAWLSHPVVAPTVDSGLPGQTAVQDEPAMGFADAALVLQEAVAGWVRVETPVAADSDNREASSEQAQSPQATPADAMPASQTMAVEAVDLDPTVQLSVPSDVAVQSETPPDDLSNARADSQSFKGGTDVAVNEEARHTSADVGFMRQARRQAAWSSAPARAALGGLALFSAALLVFQVAVHERNRLAAMAPALKPWLVQLCGPMGCDISPFQQIEAVEIVSTELVRAKDGAYRFEMGLRNNAGLPVAMPAVELSLTDRSGDTVVRRVLLPDDWVAAPPELLPNAETALTLKLSLLNPDELRMEGFRAVVFYP